MTTLARFLSGTTLIVLAHAAAAQDAPTIDVIHWLTAGAESQAVQVLAEAVEARGGIWIDSAAPGGGGVARASLMSRMAGGDPPGAAFLALGPEAIDLGQGGALRDVRSVAEQFGLDQLAQVMIDISTAGDGALYALPIGLETQNPMFFSPAAFAAAGVPVPQTWDELLASAPALQQADIIPIAVGAQGWQLGILLASVVVGTGGADTYRQIGRAHV